VSHSKDRELRRRLVRAVVRVCPSWLAGSAEDIVQAAMVRVTRSSSPGEGDRGHSSLYLEKAAFSATVDEIRRHRRRREIQADDETTMSQAPSRAASPEQGSVAREIRAGLRECLEGLVAPRRRAVALYLMGESVPGAAALFGWTPKKTENLVYRGLADLRRCLRQKGLEP
jgi:RNA polymerase sigma-70 factor (ECF subfamily)